MLTCDREGCKMPLHGFAQTRIIDGKDYHFCCAACCTTFYRWHDANKRKEGQ